jgi:glycosyltransferase involved in cell wall biosynthesis
MKPYYITITPFFPTPNNFSGPFIYDQVKAIQETRQFEVKVFKPTSWYSKEEDYEFEGIKVFRFKTYELPSNILPGLFDFLSIWSFKRKLKSMGIEINSVAVAHSHVTGLGMYANALKRANPKIKSVLQHHGFDVLSIENGMLRNLKWHRLWVKNYGIEICNKIDLHVGVSQKTLEFLESVNKIEIKDKYVLYNGVDTTKFYPIQDYKKPNCFTIGCIANFWPLKDHITLLKATKILVDDGFITIRVKMIGTGVTLSLCQQYVSDNKLEDYVEFIDKLPHNQLVYFYNTLDLFVLPSYHEAFGCVYTEAYACGVPFIAVEAQGIAELIPEKDGSKWLIKKEDFKGLAEKIQGFKVNRYQQYLTESIALDDTIGHFLKTL